MFLASSWVRAYSIELTLFTIVASNYTLVSTDDRIPFFYGKATFCYIHTISFLIQKQYVSDFYILDIVTVAKINLRVQVFLWHGDLPAEHVWLFCVSWGTIDCFCNRCSNLPSQQFSFRVPFFLYLQQYLLSSEFLAIVVLGEWDAISFGLLFLLKYCPFYLRHYAC